jgi:site-specific DNA-methyltransferase (adenine-specific)
MWAIDNENWRAVRWLADSRMVVISDPPYDARTHGGRETGKKEERGIKYAPLEEKDAHDVVDHFVTEEAAWFVFFCSHVTWQWFAKALENNNQYVFAPVPWVKPDPVPRKQGDGPDSSCEWLCIARPKERLRRYGHRPGHYFENTCSTRGKGFQGQKPLQLMQRIVLDYSEPGDTVCDPFAGSGTTLLAAVMNGRHALGTEIDEKTCRAARLRLEEFSKQPALPMVVPKKRPKQMPLMGAA